MSLTVPGRAERRSQDGWLQRWDLYEAFPCTWVLPTLAAKANAVAIEEIELAVERIELAGP